MIITQTPLRVSFLGGGTDFPDFFKKHGGGVITSAIDKYVYCIIKRRFDQKICVNYSEREVVDKIDDLRHELVREAMRKVGVKEGVEISFLADIPGCGTGLGSSGSVTVGVLNALYHYVGHTPSAEQLAREACEIEIDILKKPVGVQDQYIAAYGGLRFLHFLKSGKVKAELLKLNGAILEDLSDYLMLFFTGRTRKSETILKEQKENIEVMAKILQKMAGQARRAKRILEAEKAGEMGKLLAEGWSLKKKLASRISDRQLDGLYQRAIKAGAAGGKISGAGGGGFFLLFVPTEKRSQVRHALRDLQEMPFRLERDGSKVIFNIRR